MDRQGLFANCYSDRLNLVALACEAAGAGRDGRPLVKADVVARLDPKAPEWVLTCAGCGRPFEWAEGGASLDKGGGGRVALVWCPPGSHGRHVGAVVLEGGKVTAVMLLRSELLELQGPSGGMRAGAG